MIKWRIYYSDGSTFDSSMGLSPDAPKIGVQAIVSRHGTKGRRILKLADYYVWSPTLEHWIDCIDSASVICRSTREPWVIILSGEYIKEEAFNKIIIEAQNDLDFLRSK